MGLGDALRAADHRGTLRAGGEDRGHHGDAVVVRRVDDAAGKLARALDYQAVVRLADSAAQRGHGIAHRLEAVGLLDPQALGADDLGRALGAGGHGREGRYEVRAGSDVELAAPEDVRAHRDGRGPALDAGPEHSERGEDGAVALGAAQIHALDRDAALRERPRGEPERGVGPVPADADLARGVEPRAHGHAEEQALLSILGMALAGDVHAELGERGHGDVDVGE